MTKKTGLLLLFLAICASVHAQTCKYFTSDYELSSSLVTCIYQDSEGIVWIGTEDGLNRYDGNEFTVYRHIPGDRNSIAHNFIRVIREDASGHLLIGTYSGVQEFIREKNLFTWTPYDSDRLPLRSLVRDILPRSDGNIVISGEELFTVRFFGPENMIPGPAPLGLPTHQTSQLLEDSGHNLWVVKGNEGIYKLDYDFMLNHLYPMDSATSICEATGKGIFVSTGDDGIHFFDEANDKFVKCSIKGLDGIYIDRLEYPGDGRIYICTNDSGLLAWVPGEERCVPIIPGDIPFDSTKTKVTSVMKDNAGNLWIGISGRGVVMVPVNPNKFEYIGSRGIGLNFIGNASITSLTVSKDNRLWIGTAADGIHVVNMANFSSRHYAKSSAANGVSSQILSLFEDSKGRIWFGSFANGLGRIDRETGKCTYLLKGKVISDIAEDIDGAILIATTTDGILRYVPETGLVEPLANLNDLVGKHVECFLKTDSRTLYIGSYRGAFGVVRSSGDQPPVTMQYLTRQIVYTVFKDGSLVYFGTAEGLVTLDERTGEISSFNTNDGLPSNIIFGISGDGRNGVWISTSNGLSRFDPATRTFDNYFVGDGLQGNEFIRNAACCSPSGHLFFGGINGITHFEPAEINDPTNRWTARVRLEQQDRNSFHVTFSPAEYNAPEGIRFEFSIDHGNWDLLPSNERHVELTSLSRGKHNLEVRIVDRDERSEVTSADFSVKPPKGLSIWALLLYILILAHIVGFAISYYKLRVQAHEQLDRLKNIVGTSQEANIPVSKALLEVDDPELVSPDDRLMQRVMKVLNENISNPELTVDFIAQEVGISRVHLYRKLKEITNQTSKEFVRNIRLAKAAEMLKQKKHSIAELSEAVGYNSPSAFSTAFKELYGVSPSEYAKKKD